MKKLVSLLLTIAMLFSISTSILAADAEQKDYPQRFWDVPKDHWAFTYIAELVNKGVLNGHEDSSFWPGATVTKGEYAKMVALAAGLTVNDNNAYFTDMSGHWANPYVNAIKNYLTYYDSDLFNPDQAITREEAAATMVCVLECDLSFDYPRHLFSKFIDTGSISTVTFATYVATAIKNNLISGFEDNTFRGQDSLTRAEAATIIYRAFNDATRIKSISSVKSYSVEHVEELPPIENMDAEISDAVQDDNGNIYFVRKHGYKYNPSDGTYFAKLYKRNVNGLVEKIWDLESITATDGGAELKDFAAESICYDKYYDRLLIVGNFYDSDLINYDLNKNFLFAMTDNGIELLCADFALDKLIAALPGMYLGSRDLSGVSGVTSDFSRNIYLDDYKIYLSSVEGVFDSGIAFGMLTNYNGLLMCNYEIVPSGSFYELVLNRVWEDFNYDLSPLLIDDNLCVFSTEDSWDFYNFSGKRINSINKENIGVGYVRDSSEYGFINEISGSEYIRRNSKYRFINENNDLILFSDSDIYTLKPNY